MGDEGADLMAWLTAALEAARAEGQEGVSAYLESVREDVLLEMELASHHA